jgi:replicative DNA helicase
MYEFFGDDEIDRREQIRVNRLAGISSTGAKTISTGIRAFDDILFHKGFARKEFYCFMGRAKIGKSIALAHFAKVTSLQGLNVLFVTLEVSKEITAERIDAAITNVPMRELEKRISEIKEKIQELKDKSGKLYIEERPPDSFTPRDLTKAIQKYKGMGVKFDMVVVDYADIMSPNVRTTDAIENSKSVYLALRAIAMVEDVVMLSAMQTNREGAKSPVAKMEHAAEDFNKIRIPDLVISINATDEELAEKEARLYFAASRNQQGNFSIVIEQDLEAMQFLKRIVSIE